MSNNHSNNNAASTQTFSVLPFISLSILLGAVAVITAGIITRIKSDMKKLLTSVADAENLTRYIFLPTVCLVFFSRASSEHLAKMFTRSSFFTPLALLFISTAEFTFCGVFGKLFAPSESFMNVVSRLSLCCQSSAFPLAVILGSLLLFDKNLEQFERNFGIDIELAKLLACFILVVRMTIQRLGSRIFSVITRTESSTSSSSSPSFHNYFGDNLPAILAIVVGILFNVTGNGVEGDSGVIAFIIGVCETLSTGYIPYCCVQEGLNHVGAIWEVRDNKEHDVVVDQQKIHEQLDLQEKQQQDELLIHIVQISVRSLIVCVLGVFSSASSDNNTVVFVGALSCLSCAVPNPKELAMLFDEEKEGLMIRRICLKGFTASVILAPLLFYICAA